jgi:hypothetical protein
MYSIPSGPRGEMAAVVVVERLVDREQDRLARRVESRTAVGARVCREHGLQLIVVVAGVMQEHAAIGAANCGSKAMPSRPRSPPS